jgi:transposase
MTMSCRRRLRIQRSAGNARGARRADQRQAHGQPAEATSLRQAALRQRNLLERFFNKLEHFRAIATRYDKRDDNIIASVKLVSIRIWRRFHGSVA